MKWQCSQVIWPEKDLRDYQVYLEEAEPQRGKDDSFMIPKWEFRSRSHQSIAFFILNFPSGSSHYFAGNIFYFRLCVVFFFLFSLLYLISQLCLTLCNPHGLQPTRFLCPWEFSRQVYWSGLPSLPPGDLPNPGIEPRPPALQVDSLLLEPSGKPKNMEWVACPISRGYSWPRNQTGKSCITGGFFTSWATRVQIFFTFVLFCILSIFQNWKYIQNLIESHK